MTKDTESFSTTDFRDFRISFVVIPFSTPDSERHNRGPKIND